MSEEESAKDEPANAREEPGPERPKKKSKGKTLAAKKEASSESWGFPRFAKEFPKNAELDALVAAFARGDYATVRERAPKLAAETEDEDVRRAARTLRERIEPDPTSRMLFVIAALLLAFLSTWWVAHDGPEGNTPPASKAAPK